MKILQQSVTVLCVVALCAVGVAAQQAASPPQKPAEASSTPPRPSPTVNVRIDLTLTDHAEGAAATPKTLSMILTDRDPGRMRTGTGRDDGMLNVDVRPEIVRDNRVRLWLTVEYQPARGGEKNAGPVTQSLSTLLDDGKPLVVSQSVDPGSTRSVRVEVKATILK